jgi:hypothetical protein
MYPGEIADGLLLRGKATAGATEMVVEVVKHNDHRYIVTGDKPGICWDFQNPANFDVWDTELVTGSTVKELLDQIQGFIDYYTHEDIGY